MFFLIYYDLDKKAADDTVISISVQKQVVGDFLIFIKLSTADY